MTFLAIDTSSNHGVVSLAELDGTVKASAVFEGRRTLSKLLLGVIDGLLNKNGLTLKTLSGLAVGIGPGSFTGLRVGLTTMKTFAQVTGLPIVGVDTLAAYVHGAPTARVVVAATPSRRGEVYAAIYASGTASSPFASTHEALAERIRDLGGPAVILCGPAETLGEIPTDALRIDVLFTPPSGLAGLAAHRLAAGDIDNPISLTPLYVVPPAISTPRDSSILPKKS